MHQMDYLIVRRNTHCHKFLLSREVWHVLILKATSKCHHIPWF